MDTPQHVYCVTRRGADATGRYTQSPRAKLDYAHDWTEWLDGDVINELTWTAPPGLTAYRMFDYMYGGDDKHIARVFLSGGTLGTTYVVANTVTTAGGRTDVRHLHIAIVQT